MEASLTQSISSWPLYRKMGFRFLLIFLLLITTPWEWLSQIPGLAWISDGWDAFSDWIVHLANRYLFHIRPVLVPTGGSGDTSFGWAALCTWLAMAFAGSIIWSAADRRARNYDALNYWLCLIIRYNIALVALSYGIIKLFCLQMPFPNISQMATPLGNFLPMRLSWMFLGYSGPYQFFSGCMEVMVGLLLLYRRTATLGAVLATAVFVNVMMLNLSYDIPVKIYSMEIVLQCLVLMANEWKRIACFFLLNRPADACSIYYRPPFRRRWLRISRIVVKAVVLLIGVVLPFSDSWGQYREQHTLTVWAPVRPGLYDVAAYVLNGDSLRSTSASSKYWQDMVLEGDGMGSAGTTDSLFRQRYGRGYFYYRFDTTGRTMEVRRQRDDSTTIAHFHYAVPDTATLQLWGKVNADSVQVFLRRSPRHFQLAEKQFHWLSEANR